MARPRSFDQDQALDTAVRVFWQRGYAATTLATLVQETGVQRASLYRTFGNKAQIYALALERYGAWRIGRLVPHPDPREMVRQWLWLAVDDARTGAHPRGCLLVQSMWDLSVLEPELRVLVGEHRKRLQAFFTGCAAQAAPHADADAIGGALLAADIGLFMLSRPFPN
jgi:TetR/AcrR family transcriptional repressor of nem operon